MNIPQTKSPAHKNPTSSQFEYVEPSYYDMSNYPDYGQHYTKMILDFSF